VRRETATLVWSCKNGQNKNLATALKETVRRAKPDGSARLLEGKGKVLPLLN
jgi:hypothetical protein